MSIVAIALMSNASKPALIPVFLPERGNTTLLLQRLRIRP